MFAIHTCAIITTVFSYALTYVQCSHLTF